MLIFVAQLKDRTLTTKKIKIMATANFWTFDANSIYAISSNDLDEMDRDDFSFHIQDVIDNIKDGLGKLNNKTINVYEPYDKYNGLPRNFNGYKITTLSLSKDYGDLSVEIIIDVVMGNGYYDGVNFDFITKLYIDGYEQCDYHEIDKYFDLANFGSKMNSGMLKIQNQNAKKWIEKNVPIIHKQIEKILKKHTTHELKTAARFSNGETMYIEV